MNSKGEERRVGWGCGLGLARVMVLDLEKARSKNIAVGFSDHLL